jgi:hypothetical protein
MQAILAKKMNPSPNIFYIFRGVDSGVCLCEQDLGLTFEIDIITMG